MKSPPKASSGQPWRLPNFWAGASSAPTGISLALALGFSALYLTGLAAVPFHPDESTQIFMSRDFARLFLQHDLTAFVWRPGEPISSEVGYRLLDAPLPKYLIGFGGWLAGYTLDDLNPDWDWRMTWEENLQAKHLPNPGLLLASRMPSALLTALSTVLMFWIGRAVRHTGVGLAAALLFGFNALTLLHGRRAMAEGVAMFFALLAVWACLQLLPTSDKQQTTRPSGQRVAGLLVAGLALGLAFASKQTNLALVPVALFVSLNRSARTTLQAWLIIFVSSGLTFGLLNPILYRDPMGVARAMLAARTDLAQRQVADFPGLTTPTPPARLQAALLQVYWQPLAYSDLPIYTEALQPQITAYESNPLPTFTRSLGVGAVLLGLTLIGIMVSGWRVWQTRPKNAETALWVWGAATLGLTLLVIPLNWQRYFLPLLPLAGLFSALGLAPLAELVRRLYELRHHHQR